MKIKDIILKHFIDFLKENKLTVYYETMCYYPYYYVNECPDNGTVTDYNNEYSKNNFSEFIMNTRMDKLLGNQHKEYFSKFVDKLYLDKKLHSTIAKYIHSIQLPQHNIYYVETINDSLTFLQQYPEIYFAYVKQSKFLESNLKKLDSIFNQLNQEQKEEIIQTCFLLKTFKSLESQTFLFNLIKNTLPNHDQYRNYFPNIKPIDNNEYFIGNSVLQQSLTYKIPIRKLHSVDVLKQYETVYITKQISDICLNINKLPESILSLNITHADSSKIKINDEPYISIQIYGNNLEQNKINYFLNRVISVILKTDDYLSEEQYLNIFNDSLHLAKKCDLHDSLQENMPNKISQKRKKI